MPTTLAGHQDLPPRADYTPSPLRTTPISHPVEAQAEGGLSLPLLAGVPQGLAPSPPWSPEVYGACGRTEGEENNREPRNQ